MIELEDRQAGSAPMALVDALKWLKLHELNSDQKKKLRKILLEHKRALQARIVTIDRGVARLAGKPSARKVRKRRGKR
jgi:hypothetical protein